MGNFDRAMRGTTVRCDKLAPEHVDEALELLRSAFPPDPDQNAENLTVLSRQNIGEIENIGRAYPMFVAVAEGSGRVVGVATTKPHGYESTYVTGNRWFGETAILNQTVVREGGRGHGIATALIGRTIEECFAVGHAQVFAHIADRHADWYAANGWTVPPSTHWWAWVERHCKDDYDVAINVLRQSPRDATTFGSVMYLFAGNPQYPRLARMAGKDAPVGGHARVVEQSKGDDVPRILLGDLQRKPRKWSRLPLGTARELRAEKVRLGF